MSRTIRRLLMVDAGWDFGTFLPTVVTKIRSNLHQTRHLAKTFILCLSSRACGRDGQAFGFSAHTAPYSGSRTAEGAVLHFL